MIVSGQLSPSDTSDTYNTVGAIPQLSASSVTTVTSGAGTSPIHDTVTGPGLLAVGLILTSTVKFFVAVAVLPKRSEAVKVTVTISEQLSKGSV